MRSFHQKTLILLLTIVTTFFCFPTLAKETQEVRSVKTLLKMAGMDRSFTEMSSLEKQDLGISCLYFLNQTSWIKFMHKPGSNGAFFIKHLNRSDPSSLKHRKKRLEITLSLILEMNRSAKRPFLASPLTFDEKGQVFSYFVPRSTDKTPVPSHLAETFMTYWSHLRGTPPKCTSSNIWNPCNYSVETLRSLVKALWDLQTLGEKVLQKKKDRKIILEQLTHENRGFIGYDAVKNTLLHSLGLHGYTQEGIEKQLHYPHSKDT